MKTEYKGSIAETNILNTNDVHQLINARGHYAFAVRSHTQDGNKDEAAFFQAGLDLIDTKIKKLSGDAVKSLGVGAGVSRVRP